MFGLTYQLPSDKSFSPSCIILFVRYSAWILCSFDIQSTKFIVMDEPTTVHTVSMNLLHHWDVFSETDEDGVRNIKSFYSFRNQPNRGCEGGTGMIILTSDDQAYGLGHNCSDVNILGLHSDDPAYRQETVYELSSLPLLSQKKIAQMSIGGLLGAALSDCGTLYWWGNCYNRQAGDLMTPHIPRTGRRRYLRVSCGYNFMVTLTFSGSVYVWGQVVNNSSRFMEGERILVNSTIASISCGLHHLAMIDDSGILYTWGRGDEGQRGFDGYTDDDQYKVTRIIYVPCSVVKCGPYSTFCITTDYVLMACGSNRNLYLGLNQPHPVTTMSRICLNAPPTDVVAVGMTADNTAAMAARTADGGFYTWGFAHTSQPSLAEAGSFMEIFTSWQLTPELMLIRLQDHSTDLPLSPHIDQSILITDVLLYIYLRDRPELAQESARYRRTSKSLHLAHLASQVASEGSGREFLMNKYLNDIRDMYQICPCEGNYHCPCPYHPLRI